MPFLYKVRVFYCWALCLDIIIIIKIIIMTVVIVVAVVKFC